jgi:LemA protein
VIALWIIIGLVVVLGIAAVFSYNRFVSQKTLIKDAWANIDTELRRRYDLIPNLVETVRGYASHEREVFEEVTRARAMATAATGSPAEQAAAEGPLVAALRQLFAVVENYPDLKANQNFLALQAELSNTEDRLQTARRFYNANVRDYNRRVAAFPSSVIANMFKFREEQYFEVDEALRGDAGVPRVSFGGEAPGVTFGDGGGPTAPPPAGTPSAPIAGGGETANAPAPAESAPAPAEAAPAEEPTPPTPERPDE